MKVETKDDKVIIYLYKDPIVDDNYDKLNNKIKDIVIKIMKRYGIDFYGYSKVNVYHNDYYGDVLEIEKIYDTKIMYNMIDLKIVVYRDVPMYFEFDDYCFFNRPKEFIIKNEKFYIEIKSGVDINRYIEYGKIVYLSNMKKIIK